MVMLLRRIFSRAPREGDLVTVMSGPYADRSGTVIGLDGSRVTVYIDECCQPQLDGSEVRRVWRGRNIHVTARKARESDVAAEEVRAIMAMRDNIDGRS